MFYILRFVPVLLLIGVALNSLAAPGVIPKDVAALFPMGRVFTGVKIPSYSDDDLKSVLEADTITRLNRAFLKLTNVVIKVYNTDGELESTVKMKVARYNLARQELQSTTPARIDHEKFVMTGNRIGFDTKNDVTRLKGNVRVVVPKATQFTGNLGRKVFGGK